MKLARLQEVYRQPLFELIRQSREVYLENWNGHEVQLCTLLSIKTGGCSEDCAYCAQSAHYGTEVERGMLLTADDVLPIARQAKENGSTRFCMGAAWRGISHEDPKFEQILGIVREVSKLGLEVCVTLGELTPEAARQLREAGVTAYNHNIDTSPEFYPEIVTTHTFEDRLNTIKAVQGADMALCCGGILGMGESVEDRLRMLEVMSEFDPAPESVPITCLTAIPNTPLEDQPPVNVFDLGGMIAVTRIALPTAKVRLSAGRSTLSSEGQALCFYAGANSIFYGDRLLTTGNPDVDADIDLLRQLDLRPQEPHSSADKKNVSCRGGSISANAEMCRLE